MLFLLFAAHILFVLNHQPEISEHQVVKWGLDITKEEAENQEIAYERVDKRIVRILRVFAFLTSMAGATS